MFQKLYDKALLWSKHRHAAKYLCALSFAESSFFPVRVLIPKNVIYFYHEDHEGLGDITVLTSYVILGRFIKQSFLISK